MALFGKNKKDKSEIEKKPLLMLANNPDIAALDAKITALKEDAQKRINELGAMTERVKKAYEEQRDAVWDEIEAKIKDLLPADFSSGKYDLTFQNGVLFLSPIEPCKCVNCQLARIFGGIK
jgi:hypothetical protein